MVYDVMKTLVKKSPEAKRLLDDIHKELSAIRRLEKLRKIR